MGGACSACEDNRDEADGINTKPRGTYLAQKEFESVSETREDSGSGIIKYNSTSFEQSNDINDNNNPNKKKTTITITKIEGLEGIEATTTTTTTTAVNGGNNLTIQESNKQRKLSSAVSCYECGGIFEEIPNARSAYDGVGPVCDGCHKSNADISDDKNNSSTPTPIWAENESYYNCTQCGTVDLCWDCLSDPIIRPKFTSSPLGSPMPSPAQEPQQQLL